MGYRVPFVIWFPPMYALLSPWGKSGVVTEEMVDFHDLAPTLISLAGGEIPDHMKGRKLLGKDRSPVTDHLVLSSDRSDNGIDMVRSVTDGRFMYSRNFMPFMPEARYIRYMEIAEIKQQMRKDLADNKLNTIQKQMFLPRPAEFLFDTKNDPWELKNLIDDPKHKTVVAKMRTLLSEEMLGSKDIMLLPEFEIASISQKTTAYEFRSNDADFPIKAIFEAATLSGKRGKTITTEQIALLKSENKIRRYWAALGLRSQSPENLKPYKKELLAAMQDAYEPAAVTTAAVCFEVFADEKAAEHLIHYCDSKSPEIALMAINYLLYVTDKKPFITTIQSVHKAEGRYNDTYKSATYKVKAACMDFLAILSLVPNTVEASK